MLWDIVKRFPPWVTSPVYKELFEQLELPVSPSRYLTFALIVGGLVFLISYWLGIWYVGLGVLAMLLAYPFLLKKEREERIVAELPLFLIDLGALLNIGVPLLESLRIAAQPHQEVKEIVENILKRVEKNESLGSILLSFIQRYQHPVIKRAFTQLIAAIEAGSGQELKKLGIELLKQQVHLIKEFGGKLSVITQFFISFNVILPVFVVLLVTAVPMINNQPPSLELLNQLMFIVFPLLGIAFLLLAYVMIPHTAFSRPKIDWEILLIGIIGVMIIYGLGLDILSVAGIAIGLFLVGLIWEWKKGRDESELLEKEVPEILLMLSAFPRFDLQEFFQYLKESNLKAIKKVADRVLNILSTNQNPDEVFRYLKSLKGTLFSRFVAILEFSYHTGSSVVEKLAEWAEALYQYLTAKKDIEALFTIQKYTLIIGALLVPTILGAMVKIFQVLFEVDLFYIYGFVVISTALIVALIRMVSDLRIYWYFLLVGLGVILFYQAWRII